MLVIMVGVTLPYHIMFCVDILLAVICLFIMVGVTLPYHIMFVLIFC